MEQHVCLYPRIIVDESKFSFDPNESFKLVEDKLYSKDIDGKMDVNSLACISKVELNELILFLVGGAFKGLSDLQCKGDPNVLMKYEWLHDYITEYLSETGLQHFPKKDIKR